MSAARAGRLVALRHLTDADMPAVYDLFTSDPEIQDVHLQGAVPSLEAFRAGIWQGVAGHWVICRTSSSAPIGLTTLASVDYRNGYGYLSIVVAGDQREVFGVAGEAMALSIDHVFRTFPLRVLYFDVARPVFERRFARLAGRYLEIDGVRRNHLFHDGGYVDMYMLSLTRSRWETFGPQRLARFAARGARPPAAPD